MGRQLKQFHWRQREIPAQFDSAWLRMLVREPEEKPDVTLLCKLVCFFCECHEQSLIAVVRVGHGVGGLRRENLLSFKDDRAWDNAIKRSHLFLVQRKESNVLYPKIFGIVFLTEPVR